MTNYIKPKLQFATKKNPRSDMAASNVEAISGRGMYVGRSYASIRYLLFSASGAMSL